MLQGADRSTIAQAAMAIGNPACRVMGAAAFTTDTCVRCKPWHRAPRPGLQIGPHRNIWAHAQPGSDGAVALVAGDFMPHWYGCARASLAPKAPLPA